MKTNYFVIDGETDGTSWDEAAEENQSYATEEAAIARAKELAEKEPQNTFFVAIAYKSVKASPVRVTVKNIK